MWLVVGIRNLYHCKQVARVYTLNTVWEGGREVMDDARWGVKKETKRVRGMIKRLFSKKIESIIKQLSLAPPQFFCLYFSSALFIFSLIYFHINFTGDQHYTTFDYTIVLTCVV
jgi:hypothetical protein